MHIPHTFPSLLNPSSPQPVLFIGAGMSFGLVPTIPALTQEIRDTHNAIISKLGIDLEPPAPGKTGTELYEWAENVFNDLTKGKGLKPDVAKLQLADAMGITTDSRYHAKVGIPLRGNTPRHRIAARFAREGRWGAIWSLNWDCILEAALESTGLLDHPDPASQPSNPLPWRRWYCTWTPGDTHTPVLKQSDTLHVIKPHGCVNKLAKRIPVFIITKSELADMPTQLKLVPGRMMEFVSDVPLTTVGWRADEQYIHANVEEAKKLGMLAKEVDKLSIIDPFWDSANHSQLATAFDTDQNSCHFKVSGNDKPINTDQLFQWLQTCYGLERLEHFATANGKSIPAWNGKATELKNMISQLAGPEPADWLNSFFDDFLAVWVRLCCNAGKVAYKQNGVTIQRDTIATYRRDEHIPWGYGHSERPDLLAVIPLIFALRGTLLTNTTTQWSFDEFPGALWDSNEGHLVLPIPAWAENNNPLELAAIKPLTERSNWPRKGIIQKLSILPLLPNPDYAQVNDDKFKFRSSIAWLMTSGKFSDPNNIGVVILADI